MYTLLYFEFFFTYLIGKYSDSSGWENFITCILRIYSFTCLQFRGKGKKKVIANFPASKEVNQMLSLYFPRWTPKKSTSIEEKYISPFFCWQLKASFLNSMMGKNPCLKQYSAVSLLYWLVIQNTYSTKALVHWENWISLKRKLRL